MATKLARFSTPDEADAFAAGILLVNDTSIQVTHLYIDNDQERPYVAKIVDSDAGPEDGVAEFIDLEYEHLWIDFTKVK